VSSVAQREQLDAVLKFVRKGDTFAVTNMDRLARFRAWRQSRSRTPRAEVDQRGE
jgi:DNA invertase Pin-like site-specific DNA recombinase